MKKDAKSLLADFSLLFTGVIWGTGFAANQYALDGGVSISLILLLRFSIAAVLMGLIFIRKIVSMTRRELGMGLVAGILLFLGFLFQTLGLASTSPSNNAFITATNVVMVPFITWMFTRNRPRSKSFILAACTFVGVGLLTYSSEMGLNFALGDFYTLICAVFFAGHIAYLDRASKKMNPATLAFLQMAAAALLSLIAFTVIDDASLGDMDFSRGLLPVFYLGLFSTLLCFLIQTTAQRHTTSTKAAIFLSTEALFGAFFSVLLGLELFSGNMLVGGGIILFSIIASEISFKVR